MPPTLPAMARPRPAAVVNAAIRALVHRARGRRWTQAERALYAVLRDEWVDAMRDEMTEAA